MVSQPQIKEITIDLLLALMRYQEYVLKEINSPSQFHQTIGFEILSRKYGVRKALTKSPQTPMPFLPNTSLIHLGKANLCPRSKFQ